MDFQWLTDNEAARWMSATVGTLGAFISFKHYRQKVREAEMAEANLLNDRFDKKANVDELERLAADVDNKADALVTARDTKRLDGEITRMREVVGTMFDQIRENDQRAQDRHEAVMNQLLQMRRGGPRA